MSGRELISAKGAGHSAITSSWITIVISIIVGIGGIFVIPDFLYDICGIYMSDDIVKAIAIFMIILSIIELIWGFVIHNNISLNAVHVYDDCIKGLSINDMAQLTDFNLTYSQVSSVDVISGGKILVIHAASSKYKIYAMNAVEVRDVIVAQKNMIG
jgi:hypothetical protein